MGAATLTTKVNDAFVVVDNDEKMVEHAIKSAAISFLARAHLEVTVKTVSIVR